MINNTSYQNPGVVMCIVMSNLFRFFSAVCVCCNILVLGDLQKEQTVPVKFHLRLNHIPELIWKNLRNRTIDMIMLQFTGCTGSKLCVLFSYRDLNKKASSIKNSKAKIELLGSYDPEKQLIIQDPYYVSVHTCTKQDKCQTLVIYCQILNESSQRPKIKWRNLFLYYIIIIHRYYERSNQLDICLRILWFKNIWWVYMTS